MKDAHDYNCKDNCYIFNIKNILEFSQFSPDIPFEIGFPLQGICGDQKILIVGVVPEGVKTDPEFILKTNNGNEAFHVMISKADNVIYRWGLVDGVKQAAQGEPLEGTTIDYNEPFTMIIKCDDDGWVLQVNTEQNYPNFIHLFSPLNVTGFEITGDVMVTFVGIGDEGEIKEVKQLKKKLCYSAMEAAPKIGFNLTYSCPEGEVFNHDWFATPFVLMTCQVQFIS